ncbi:amp dependent CoA ligase [Mycena sp. CBHHK59/15]|nr:amp dependent CoA ligase [Mycena sp. CBHHK59/15]
MTEFSGAPLDQHVPDNLTLAQFILDYQHPLRPPIEGTCLIEDATGRTVSWSELRERTSGLASSLRAKYNIVLLCSPNHVDYPVALWATQRLGAIFSGASPSSTPNELVYQLKITEATLIIAHSATLDTVTKAANLVGLCSSRVIILDSNPSLDVVSAAGLIADELASGAAYADRILGPGEGKTKVAALCMSSGTTGHPKAVAISHTAIIANLIQLSFLNQSAEKNTRKEGMTVCPGDVANAVLPFFHIAGLVFNLHFLLFYGVTLVVIPKFDFIAMLDSITRHNIQHLMQVISLFSMMLDHRSTFNFCRLVPPIAIALCKHPAVKQYDLCKIKFVGAGAAPMTSELQQQLRLVCPQAKVGQAYGLTETAAILAMTPMAQQCSNGCVGMLLPGVRARVVKADGSLAGFNEPGELVVQTPSLSLGYYKNEAASTEAFTDGWLRTGDEVKIDRNGEVWITDRLKELIKVRGFQVSPAELEGLILHVFSGNHPDVSDACVVGIPDEASGEVPLAFVVLTEAAAKQAKINPELIQASIKKHVANNKVRYKHLAGVEFTPLIPKNASGKILRQVLREQAMDQLQLVKSKL